MPCRSQVEYKHLLPHQFKKRFDEMPVAYLPIGSLEWHGEHLCLGNDGVKVEELCKLAAAAGGGIVMPGVFLGILGMTTWAEKYDMGNGGIFNIEPELFDRIIKAQLTGLERLGFKGVLVITGHYPQEQVVAVQTAAAQYSAAGGMKAVGITDRDLARSAGHTGDHAAKWETSLLMSLRPQLVDLTQLPPDGPLEGIYGDDPRTTASAELGKEAVDVMVAEMVDIAAGLVP